MRNSCWGGGAKQALDDKFTDSAVQGISRAIV